MCTGGVAGDCLDIEFEIYLAKYIQSSTIQILGGLVPYNTGSAKKDLFFTVKATSSQANTKKKI